MGVYVDESRAEHMPPGVDFFGRSAIEFSDREDFAVGYGDITLKGGRSGTIDDFRIADREICLAHAQFLFCLIKSS